MINPPFLHPTTDFKAEKDGGAANDVNGDGGGGFEVVPGVGDGKWFNSVARRSSWLLVSCAALQKL